jgi:hypothetical protein
LNDVNDLGWSIKYRMASAHQWLEYWIAVRNQRAMASIWSEARRTVAQPHELWS